MTRQKGETKEELRLHKTCFIANMISSTCFTSALALNEKCIRIN